MSSRFIIVIVIAVLFQSRAAADPVNLALGHTVKFSPAPNGSGTSAGDATDLTNGVLSTWNPPILSDPVSVSWSYPGLTQLGLDLGADYDIGEVSIRLSGGSTGDGKAFPCWVALAASDDGVTYHQVASYSRFTPGDQAAYGVPYEGGVGWAYNLRFQNVNIHARYIGIELYGTKSCGSDELYVWSGTAGPYASLSTLPVTDFSVDTPRAYFHKPVVPIPSNITAPTPIGLNVPPGWTQDLTFEFQLPPGMHCYGGKVAGALPANPTGTALPDGYTDYITTSTRASAKNWTQFHLQFDPGVTQSSGIRYRLSWSSGSTPLIEQPVRPMVVGSAPAPRRIMTGLCYLSWGPLLAAWPNIIGDFESVGFNTLPVFTYSVSMDAATTAALQQFRAAGFKFLNIDNTFDNLLVDAGSNKGECCCQFASGSVGTRPCLSYRGTYYQYEIARLADQCAKTRIDILECDIENWLGSGSPDASNCTRCQADFAASGAGSWAAWHLLKGGQIAQDITNAIRTRAAELGVTPAEVGFYDNRPGMNYQSIWPFDQLYPTYWSNSEVSTYSPLYPYNIIFTGSEVRRDRQLLGHSDVLPWISPGDAGVFPPEMLTWAILECYANGARGVNFWSHRLWDAELLDAYARSTRIVEPVEDVVMDGDLVSDVTCSPVMHVAGMRHGFEQFLLIAKDYELYSGPVQVTIPAPQVPVEAIDLDTNQVLTTLAISQTNFTLTFDNERARVLRIRPTETFDASDLYVQFSFDGLELGTLSNPFDTLAEGVAAANPHATIHAFIGDSAEHPLRIEKPLRIEAVGGPVRIGAAAP